MTLSRTPSPSDYLLASASDRDRLYLQFDLFHDHFCRSFARALALACVDAATPWRALDVACGEGLYSADLVDRYPDATVVGFDRDAESIATARAAFADRARSSFHLADVHEPLGPIIGNGFDVAFAECGLAHFKNGSLALRNVHEVLRPGGAIMLLDPTLRMFEYPHPSLAHLCKAIRDAWGNFGTYAAADRHAELLADAGFVDITTEPQDYIVGGPTPKGQTKFLILAELLRSMRSSLVERAHTISAADFDELLEQFKAANDGHREGCYWYRRAIARKPA